MAVTTITATFNKVTHTHTHTNPFSLVSSSKSQALCYFPVSIHAPKRRTSWLGRNISADWQQDWIFTSYGFQCMYEWNNCKLYICMVWFGFWCIEQIYYLGKSFIFSYLFKNLKQSENTSTLSTWALQITIENWRFVNDLPGYGKIVYFSAIFTEKTKTKVCECIQLISFQR